MLARRHSPTPGDDAAAAESVAAPPTWEPPSTGERVRQVVNILNLSTALGLFVALVGGAELSQGPRRTLLATGYRYRFPIASAFTVGDVIITKMTLERLSGRERLLRHESRHSMQYACWLGPLMLIAYGLAAGWSWARTGDPASRNHFERRAGLDDGGYTERPLRSRARRAPPP